MNKYGLTFNNGDDLICLEANGFAIEDGFVVFYRYERGGNYIRFAAYAASNVSHCVQQKEYTADEILKHINGES